MSGDLRARIAEALTRWVLDASGERNNPFVPHQAAVRENSAARADVVMAVVQPELDAKDAEIARLRDLNAKLKATIDAFPDANSAANLAHARRERDRLRELLRLAEADNQEFSTVAAAQSAAVERVREILDYFDGQIIALESGNPAVGSAFRFTFTKIRAALDQAPAAESPYATGGEILPRTQGDQIPAQLSGCDFAINPEPAAEQDEGEGK